MEMIYAQAGWSPATSRATKRRGILYEPRAHCKLRENAWWSDRRPCLVRRARTLGSPSDL